MHAIPLHQRHEITSAWQLDPRDFPHTGTQAEQIHYVVRFALLAPSTHNTQPWAFQFDKPFLDVWALPTRGLPVIDPTGREMVMSCGAAIYHLRVTLARFALPYVLEVLPDPNQPDWLARFTVSARPPDAGRPDLETELACDAILRRHTNRQPFADRPVVSPVQEVVRMAATDAGCWLALAASEEDKAALATLIACGDRLQMANPAFRSELTAWMRSNRSSRHDGIPTAAAGRHNLQSLAGPLIMRTFDVGNGQAAHDRELATRSPLLAVLGTASDSREDWVRAGQGLERVLLQATMVGLNASFLMQPIEIPELRERVAQVCGMTGSPQAILRLGYGQMAPPTPRRPLDDVLTSTDAYP